MATMETDRLVDEYMHRLEHAAAHLPRPRRDELLAEIRGHIESALGQEQVQGEAAVRNVLDRLGSPEDIAEAAEPLPTIKVQRVAILDIAALIALIVPFLGWLVGAVLVAASKAWSRRDKVMGGLLLLVPIAILSLGIVNAGPSGIDESPPPDDPGPHPVGEKVESPTLAPGPAELLLLVAGLPSALYLGTRLRGREPEMSP